MARGVKPGYRHLWKYTGLWNEKKIGKGLWKGSFRATKGKRSKSLGGFPKGTKVLWKLTGTQTARKTAKGRYQTNFKFRKKLLKINVPRHRRKKF